MRAQIRRDLVALREQDVEVAIAIDVAHSHTGGGLRQVHDTLRRERAGDVEKDRRRLSGAGEGDIRQSVAVDVADGDAAGPRDRQVGPPCRAESLRAVPVNKGMRVCVAVLAGVGQDQFRVAVAVEIFGVRRHAAAADHRRRLLQLETPWRGAPIQQTTDVHRFVVLVAPRDREEQIEIAVPVEVGDDQILRGMGRQVHPPFHVEA